MISTVFTLLFSTNCIKIRVFYTFFVMFFRPERQSEVQPWKYHFVFKYTFKTTFKTFMKNNGLQWLLHRIQCKSSGLQCFWLMRAWWRLQIHSSTTIFAFKMNSLEALVVLGWPWPGNGSQGIAFGNEYGKFGRSGSPGYRFDDDKKCFGSSGRLLGDLRLQLVPRPPFWRRKWMV